MFRNQFLLLVALLAGSTQGMKMARVLSDFQCQEAGISCLDCGSLVMCMGGDTLTAYEVDCGDSQVCGESGNLASCFDESAPEAQQCHCGGVSGKMPDVFDITKYIMCLPDGTQVSVPCPDSLVYNHDRFTCEAPPPTTTPFMPTCTEVGFFPRLPTCTSYYACYVDDAGSLQSSKVFECITGERFDETVGRCAPESQLAPPTFQCGDMDGIFADTVECNAFHICVGGAKYGATLCCNEGQMFDPKTLMCSETVSEDSCPTMGPCVDMSSYEYACGGPVTL